MSKDQQTLFLRNLSKMSDWYAAGADSHAGDIYTTAGVILKDVAHALELALHNTEWEPPITT